MDRRVVDEILSLPESDQFLRGLRALVGFKQTGVDYVRPARAFGRSNNSWRRNIWWAKKGVFSFSFAPIDLLGYIGAALTGLAFLGLVYQLVDFLRRPAVPHGIAIIIALILFFGGANLLAIAVLGEYVIRIFDETKRRPKFIRKAIRQGGRHHRTSREIQGFLDSHRPPMR
jgi:dolichol-phosphate mannosyltransferase